MTDSLSLHGLSNRINQAAREKDEKRGQERRRNLLYLIADFLLDQGYANSTDSLTKEAQLSRDNIQVCDNIDLETILLEYSDYYYTKFNKYPKLCRKIEIPNNNGGPKKDKTNKVTTKQEPKVIPKIIPPQNNSTTNLEITVTPIFPLESNEPSVYEKTKPAFVHDERILKPIGNLYPTGSEWREIADVISKEIVLTNLNVHWDDILGLNESKTLLKEATVYPLKYPTLFNEKLDPWRGILLYGPPGTGKTMLAKAVATECQSTFFNITSSSIISKWRGDSEKYVRVLIDLAKYYAPTIIFIDEIDWTSSGSGDYSSSNSEPARRFRAELLARLDGLFSMQDTNVILLAATNVPWNIDIALLRRLEKKIFVDLPDEESRGAILRYHIRDDLHKSIEYAWLVNNTEGYSCADLKLLCKEAWINQLRPIWKSLENNDIRLNNVHNDNVINSMGFLTTAMGYVRPTAFHTIERYKEWNKNFGFKRNNSLLEK